jgi:hypothetical protein
MSKRMTAPAVTPPALRPDRVATPLGPKYEPIRRWLVGRYSINPEPQDFESLGTGPAVFVRRSDFVEFLLSIDADPSASLVACREAGWTADLRVDIHDGGDPYESSLCYYDAICPLDLPDGSQWLLGIRSALLALAIDATQQHPRAAPSREIALTQYRDAIQRSIRTDGKLGIGESPAVVWRWLESHEDRPALSLPTWCRYVRGARKNTGD